MTAERVAGGTAEPLLVATDLASRGIALENTPAGTRWKVVGKVN